MISPFTLTPLAQSIKISVLTDVSVFGFYGYIGHIGGYFINISVNIRYIDAYIIYASIDHNTGYITGYIRYFNP